MMFSVFPLTIQRTVLSVLLPTAKEEQSPQDLDYFVIRIVIWFEWEPLGHLIFAFVTLAFNSSSAEQAPASSEEIFFIMW